LLDEVKAWIDERGRRLKEADRVEDLANRQRYVLEWDEVELRVVKVGIKCRVEGRGRWESVRKVFGFKRDLWNVDQVCITVETDDLTLQLDEDFARFWDFQADLPNHLPGALGATEFWERVVFPAFQPCLTTLYEANPRNTGVVVSQ
jgi:hypothetical protein